MNSATNSYKVDSEALRLAREFVAEPDKRACAIRAIRSEVGPKTAALVEEAAVVAHELIRLAELPPHGPKGVQVDPEVAEAVLPSLHSVLCGIDPEDLGWISRLVDELNNGLSATSSGEQK